MRIDRLLLALYFVALMGLLMFPFEGPNFRVIGVASDKWMHFALFGGLAVLLRWNLSTVQHSILMSIGLAFIVAAATEVAQGLVAYRSAEFFDLLASLIGAIVGAMIAHQIYMYPTAQKLIGAVTIALGLMIGSFFSFCRSDRHGRKRPVWNSASCWNRLWIADRGCRRPASCDRIQRATL